MKRIAILGAGSWATGLASVLLNNGHQVTIWSIDRDQVELLNKTKQNPLFIPEYTFHGDISFTTDLQKAVTDRDFVLNTVPTQGIRSALEKKPILSDKTIIINASKGLETGSLKRIGEVVAEFYPKHIYAVISGPSHAEEVVVNMPTTLVAACADKKVSKMVQDIFMTDYIRVYSHPDVKGVELSGALKNIIAIAAGVCDGMGFGDNAIAALITRGIAEIKRLGLAMGAKSQTFDGLAGIGDLIVTCTSQHSRNRRCGKLLGEGYNLDEAIKKIGMVVEGATTVQAAESLRKKHQVEMPIVEQLYQVLYCGFDPKEAVKKLMLREKRHEMEAPFTEDAWG